MPTPFPEIKLKPFDTLWQAAPPCPAPPVAVIAPTGRHLDCFPSQPELIGSCGKAGAFRRCRVRWCARKDIAKAESQHHYFKSSSSFHVSSQRHASLTWPPHVDLHTWTRRSNKYLRPPSTFAPPGVITLENVCPIKTLFVLLSLLWTANLLTIVSKKSIPNKRGLFFLSSWERLFRTTLQRLV